MKASTKTLSRPQMLLAATALDWAIGDPEYLPHPVRLLGTAIARGERTFNRAGASRNQSFIAGALLTSALVTVTYLATRKLLHLAYRMHPVIGSLTEVTLASTCLASRNLHDEAAAVVRSLEAHDLPTARGRLARIVGRDTAELGVEGIARGVIETLAESACDGVVAPLFYLAAGGVPLAMAFKAISTLDSMIGHTTPRYLYFGKAAAGLDDVANYVPARLTAVAIAASAALSTRASAVQALRLWQRDGDRHASPNAGQPEAAMAGALGVQLGGASTYQGEPHHAPILGRQFPPPAARHARTALHLVAVTGFIATLAACALLKSCSRSRASMTYPVHGGQLHAIAAAFGLPADDLLDFSASINPDGPPASVYTALRQALLLPATLTRYPDLEHTRLRAALSIHHGMGPECFTVANGFGPLLRAALEACSAPGAASTNHLPSRCMMPVPCFNEYRRTLEQARMTAIPYSLDPPSFCIEPADLLAAAARNACGSILLANLQNPSGTLHDAPLLRALVAEAASEGITVFLDEAFIDYAPEQSLTMFAAETSNLIVFRSVTKFFSIPGLRVAYAAANPQTIRNIGAQVASWPIDTLATAAVIAALEDEHFAVTSRARNRQRRTQLQAQLEAIGIRVYPAAANFLLLRLPTQLAGDTWQRLILEHRIVTRDCSGFEGLGPGHLRVAVLHESRNSRLVDAFSNLL